MPPLLPILFTLMVVAVVIYVVVRLIQDFPSYGIGTVKMLALAAVCLVVIFLLAGVFGISILGGLRLR
jgi:hypothetical protein